MTSFKTHVWLLCAIVAICSLPCWAHSSLYDAPGGRIQAQTNYEGVDPEVFDALLAKPRDLDSPTMLVETFSHFGEPILCELPRISFSEEGKDEATPKASIASVPSFLMPLRSKCMRHLDGWWTYEFCFGKHIRQFHVTPQGKLDGEYFLGRVADPKQGIALLEELESNEASLLKHLESRKIDLAEELDYYSERYAHGTACDLTTSERSVEVRWTCASSASASSIRSIKEPISCQYILEVESPLLCQHPSYTSSETPLHHIHCYFARKDAPEEILPPEIPQNSEADQKTATQGRKSSSTEEIQAEVNKEEHKESIKEIAISFSQADQDDQQASQILKDTIRNKVKDKLAIFPPESDSLEDEEARVLDAKQLNKLLDSLSDTQLLMLLATVDEAIALAKEQDHFDGENELIVLEWDDMEMLEEIFAASSSHDPETHDAQAGDDKATPKADQPASPQQE